MSPESNLKQKHGNTMKLVKNTYDDKAAVNEAKSARSPDAGAAVDDWWPVVGIQHPWLANSLQELQERGGRTGDPEVGPGGVVELHDIAALTAFKIVESVYRKLQLWYKYEWMFCSMRHIESVEWTSECLSGIYLLLKKERDCYDILWTFAMFRSQFKTVTHN